MPTAKVLYFNWRKAEKEDDENAPHTQSLKRVTWTGDLLVDRPDLYDHVADIDYWTVEKSYESVCEEAFCKFNRHDGNPLHNFRFRSMSVGDIVLFPDGKLFVVQGCGWKEFSGHSLVFWERPKVEEQTA